MVQQQSELYKKRIAAFEQELRTYQGVLKTKSYYYYSSGLELAFHEIDAVTSHLDAKTQEMEDLLHIAKNFDYPDELNGSFKVMGQMREDVANVRALLEHEVDRIKMCETFLVTRWFKVDSITMEDTVKASFKKLKELKIEKKCNCYVMIQDVFKRWLTFCPLVGELRDPSMRDRHWGMIAGLCGRSVANFGSLLLRDMWNMELHRFPSEVEDIGEQARQEAKMETTLLKLSTIWSAVEFTFEPHKGTSVMLMRIRD